MQATPQPPRGLRIGNQLNVGLITGGAGGIGSALVAALESEGWLVAVADLEPDGAGDLALSVDVTDGRGMQAAVARVERELGPLSGVVATAGVVSEHPLEDLDEAEWRRVVDVSLTGTYHLFRATLPAMAARGNGAAVAVSSGYGRAGYRFGGHYAAAKSGIEGLVKSVALEFGPDGVRVNAVAPGPVLTPMVDHIKDLQAWQRDRELRIPLGRVATPADIVGPVQFLLGEASRYVTGQVLHVNGGLLMP